MKGITNITKYLCVSRTKNSFSKFFVLMKVRGDFNKFPNFFFVQAFKIVIDSWKFSILLLYILWDDWPIFYYFRFKGIATAGIGIHPTKAWLLQLVNFKNAIWTLEERYAIKFCFKLGKNATETYGRLQTAFWPSCMNRASVFEWHKKFKEGRESMRDDKRWGRSKEVNTRELIGQRVKATMLRF